MYPVILRCPVQIQPTEHPRPRILPDSGWHVVQVGVVPGALVLNWLVGQGRCVGPVLWCQPCSLLYLPVTPGTDASWRDAGIAVYRAGHGLECATGRCRSRAWMWPSVAVCPLTDAAGLHHALAAARSGTPMTTTAGCVWPASE